MAPPPLIIITQIYMVIVNVCEFLLNKLIKPQQKIKLGKKTKVFKIIPKDEDKMNDEWDNFEHYATISYAQTVIEKIKKT
ncbi:unnamed protein product [Didymodactylos carnosus]|nr:unnamed protein product [Didymodactylos carnosus]CAF4478522.1 unnamed protein product [Didymodactylos carnosus]